MPPLAECLRINRQCIGGKTGANASHILITHGCQHHLSARNRKSKSTISAPPQPTFSANMSPGRSAAGSQDEMTPDGLKPQARFPHVVRRLASVGAHKGYPRLWQLHRIKWKNLRNNCIFDHAKLKLDEGCAAVWPCESVRVKACTCTHALMMCTQNWASLVIRRRARRSGI